AGVRPERGRVSLVRPGNPRPPRSVRGATAGKPEGRRTYVRTRCPLPPAGGENGRAPGHAGPGRRPRSHRGARAALLSYFLPCLLLAGVPFGAAAWQVPADLTLEDAIAIAERESPALLRARNDAVVADED